MSDYFSPYPFPDPSDILLGFPSGAFIPYILVGILLDVKIAKMCAKITDILSGVPLSILAGDLPCKLSMCYIYKAPTRLILTRWASHLPKLFLQFCSYSPACGGRTVPELNSRRRWEHPSNDELISAGECDAGGRRA